MSSPPRHMSILSALRNIISFTTDMGTELGLADFETYRLADVLQPWLLDQGRGSDDQLRPDLGFESHIVNYESVAPQGVLGERTFGPALAVSGMLHILHNLSWFMDSKLRHFDMFLTGLKSVLTLLHYKHYRVRYVDTCIRKVPAYAHFAAKLETTFFP
eukprot:1455598-Pyramimonas_sp.AAC.1